MTLIAGSFAPVPAAAGDDDDDESGSQRYNGAETLNLVGVAPNPARCGAAPVFELSFEGEGVDTAGGAFEVTASACQNTATGEVFDLVAIDTYFTGDSVTIRSDPFFLVPDPQTCLSANDGRVKYDIDGGTGAFAGARGGGRYDIVINDPACSGSLTPAFVSFRGRIK
ncbi:MAG: hypothetical protein AB1Z98_26080 [Nannocystaceae bacterium]